MRPIRLFLLLVAIVSLPACAPTIWDRPGTTPAEFSLDVEQCGRIAEDANRAPTVNPIATCMQSKGYVASVSGGPRGSRIRTYRPVETANVVASADIEYYRGNSDGDILRLQRSDRKLVGWSSIGTAFANLATLLMPRIN